MMNRPVWVRVLMQVVLGAPVGNSYMVLVPLLEARLHVSPITIAVHVGARGAGLLAICTFGLAAPMFAFGALAAVLTWLVVRRPWDALGASAIYAASYVVTGLTCSPRVLALRAELWWWQWFWFTLANVAAVFAGCALVAWLLQRLSTTPQTYQKPNLMTSAPPSDPKRP